MSTYLMAYNVCITGWNGSDLADVFNRTAGVISRTLLQLI